MAVRWSPQYRLPVWLLSIAIVLLLAGCSLSGSLAPRRGEEPPGPSPPYRKLVTAGLAGIVGDPKKAGKLQISGLRQVESVKGPAWLTCIRAAPGPNSVPRYYAILIQNEKIFESRLSIQTDRCEEQSFEPFHAT